ncbi:MerR family transcriptional regulator [Microbacterium excoecariae]|uniref:transcriptional regulator FtsR n=1 Tax=Microbacterium excoecariae TaxID=2715210 RepID=UPI00140BF4EE|nr:MerR family transcriptional regulator [Microbacterium excoecariae]NHI16622.1 MerR family transcriptional regulator [Microbacterium excoecariae]
MAAAAAGRAAAARVDGPLLSIGQVLSKLQRDFPKLTSSKLRFLEVQGIVSPQRTTAGYRKFSPSDLERLRLALTLQRDHYMPLTVIRAALDDLDAGRTPDLPESIGPVPGTRYTRDELLQAAGAPAQLLNDAFSLGLIEPAASYDADALGIMRSLVALDHHGIDPRHVRAMRQSAEREAALIEVALAPLLRRADTPSRARAQELAPQLAQRLDEVRGILVRQALGRILPE